MNILRNVRHFECVSNVSSALFLIEWSPTPMDKTGNNYNSVLNVITYNVNAHTANLSYLKD